jgi:hypothetical protein
MTLTALSAAGAPLSATEWQGAITELRAVAAHKASTTARTSTIVLASDADLTIALPADSTWQFECLQLLSSAANAAGDYQMQFAFPSGATCSYGAWGLDNGIASGTLAQLEGKSGAQLDVATPSTAIPYGCSTTPTGLLVVGRVAVVAAGSLTLQWAQNSSNVNATSLLGGSHLIARRIG